MNTINLADFDVRLGKLRAQADQLAAERLSLLDAQSELLVAQVAGKGDAKALAKVKAQIAETDREIEALGMASKDAEAFRRRAVAQDAERRYTAAEQTRSEALTEYATALDTVDAALSALVAANARLAAVEDRDEAAHEAQRRASSDGATGDVRPVLPVGRLQGLEHQTAAVQLTRDHLRAYRRAYLES